MKIKTMNQLASEIAKREGKKSQARIGDIREILRIIVEIEAESLWLFNNCLPETTEVDIFNDQINKLEATNKFHKAMKKKYGV